jgi:hypothetical protein
VHAQNTRVRVVGDRLGEHRTVHTRVAARLEHQKTAHVAAAPAQPVQLFAHRTSSHR